MPQGLDAQYTYNGDGLKIRRIAGAQTTRYYHDGIRPIYEAKADGSRNSDLERDIFGNFLARQDDVGNRFYYHHDGLGSTIAITNASGLVAGQRTYDAWGKQRTTSGSTPGNYQFAGGELDAASGLYHMGARFYDPSIGRWLSEDPVQDRHFEPATLNFYAYVYDNPTIHIDPDGRIVVLPLIGAALVAAWQAAEIALTIGDVVNAVRTALSNASTQEKLLAGSFALLGVLGPGGGYGSVKGASARLLAAGRHKTFIEQVAKYSDKSLLSSARSLSKRIQKHQDAIKAALASGDTKAVSHWQGELQTFQEQLAVVLEEMEQRGILGP